MEGIELRRLSPNDLGAACKVLGLAFADNPNTLVIARGDRARAQRMTESGARVAKLGRQYSHVLVAEEAAGRLVGVLNALKWPNCQLRMSEKLKVAPAMLRVTGLGLPRAFKMMTVWTSHDPGERHWHLGPIGVDPELQGRGIGKAMLAAFLDMVDGQGAAAYLETDVDRNVALYEQFGFKVIDQEDISGVNNRFMWREAAARSGGSGGSWPALEQRAMRKCEQVFGRIPEDFPPKRIVRGIEQIQEQNTHIWPTSRTGTPTYGAGCWRLVRHAA
jgi:ribosomal protein S18 acetylase RimI-like enzyme